MSKMTKLAWSIIEVPIILIVAWPAATMSLILVLILCLAL